MNHIKPLSYYICQYQTLENNMRDGITKSLLDAKSQLDVLESEYNADNARSPDRLMLADLTEPNQMTLWTSGDGSRKPICGMSDAHLHYALAKAGRGEYPDNASRAIGVRALKIEAFRRLRNELTSTPLSSLSNQTVDSAAMGHWSKAPRAFSCDWRGDITHQAHCPTLSNT